MSSIQSRRTFVKRTALSAAGAMSVSGVAAAYPAPSMAEQFLGTFGRAAELNMAFAKAMPEEHYGFRPVPEIRSYAEQLLHVAGANVFFVSSYIGGGEAPDLDFEPENPTKETVMELMAESDEYVRSSVEGMTDEQLAETVETFAGVLSKSTVCWLLRDHMTHHRGQMIIYLRLNGIEPPQYVGV